MEKITLFSLNPGREEGQKQEKQVKLIEPLEQKEHFMKIQARVKTVKVLEKRKVLLGFTDGIQRELDTVGSGRNSVSVHHLLSFPAKGSGFLELFWYNGAKLEKGGGS